MQAKQATEHIWWVGALDPDLRELDRFDTFITGKCGMPIVVLEGTVPKG